MQADGLEDVELASPERGDEGRLGLYDAVDELIDERKFVLAAVDLLLVPIDRVANVGVRVALHEVGQYKRPCAVGILPVGGACIGHLFWHYTRVVSPAEPVVPFGIECLEL